VIRALLFLWFAWQIASPQAAEHMQAGITADKERKFDVAIAEYRKVTELDPAFADGFISLGQAYMENGDYGSAIPPLKHALELKPDLLPAHQLLGYALLAQGYASQAIPHLQRAPDKTALGIAQIQTGQLPEAVANLQAALAAHPNDPDILYYLGRASGLLAKQSIDTLLAAYPDSPAPTRQWRKTTSCCGECLMLKRNTAKPCGNVRGCPKLTLPWARCMLALPSGPRQKKNSAYKSGCNLETPKQPTVWDRHYWNKGKRMRRG